MEHQSSIVSIDLYRLHSWAGRVHQRRPHFTTMKVPLTDHALQVRNNESHASEGERLGHFPQDEPSVPMNIRRMSESDVISLPEGYLRPGSKSFRHHFHTNNGNADSMGTPRLPSAPRRLSLTIPVMTSTNTNDDRAKQYQPSSPVHPIPIHLPPAAHMTSIPVHRSRISSAVPRSSPMRSSVNNQLQRQKSDIADRLSSDFSVTSFNVSPVRRNELMAREAIDGVARFQQQQLENSAATDDEDNNNNNYTSARSPSLSRRVIINLKNNQSISLDSRLSSANPSSFINPPPAPSSTRASQRNNLYHIPVLHSAPAPSPLATRSADTFDRQSSSPSVSPRQNSSYKNEFHLEIPVTFVSSNDQENQRQHARGLADYDQQQSTMFNELMGSASPYSNQALKSILKRSSSRDTISRKNVSFMNV